MAVGDWWTSVTKLRVNITSVDPANNVIDALGADAASRRLAVWEVPSNFRWPMVGEDWSIYEQNGSWYLGDRINNPLDDLPIGAMNPGEMRLDSSTIYDSNGILVGPSVGDIKWTALVAIPSGWLPCDGSALTVASGHLDLRNALISDGNIYGISGSDPLLPNFTLTIAVGGLIYAGFN